MNITTRLRLILAPATLALLAAWGGGPAAHPAPAAAPSAAASKGAIDSVLNYQACSKDGKNVVRTQLPKAANAPDLAIVDTQVVGQLSDTIRVGVVYTYNGGVKHQVVFQFHPSKKTVEGEDSISNATIDQLKAACK